jgi:chemotaxis protein CheD
MATTLSVGLGELVVSRNPEDVLVAYGLGSCVGVGMISPRTGVAGLLHAVLPEHQNGAEEESTKYADTGIPAMIKRMVKEGADINDLKVYIAGGANMLINSGLSKSFDIGTRNINSSLQAFEKHRLRLINQEVGGNIGRTVRVYVQTGKMTVRVIGGQEKEL